MSDVQALLTRCRALGATVTATHDGKLKIKAPAPLPEDLRAELKLRKPRVIALLLRTTDYRAMYRQTAEAVEEDCYAIDPIWLTDRHPALWERLVMLDDELSDMDRVSAEQVVYQARLNDLVRLVCEARALQDRQQVEAVRQ